MIVKSVLRDEVCIQKRTVLYKNHKQITKPQSEWIKVENMHEPLISKEDKVMGHIPEGICINLLSKYEAERSEKLESKPPVKRVVCTSPSRTRSCQRFWWH